MPDTPKNLSEISHLFLSGLRQRQTQGAPRPTRIGPARAEPSVDLTAEEFAQVFDGEKEKTAPAIGSVRTILASHLGTHQLSHVQQYASHICPPGKRIGLIAVDASEFRVSIFEHNPRPIPVAQTHESEILDSRKMYEALDELAWDVDGWLLLLPSPRAPEARSLLRDVNHWTMLSTCDHDGVVACYRTLKGLSDLNRPRLSLATVGANNNADASAAYQRLSSVCRQFLDLSVENEGPIAPANGVTEHVVLWCCGTRDKAQLATAPQWQVVADFLAKARKAQATPEPAAEPISERPIPIAPQEKRVIISPTAAPMAPQISTGLETPEVIDLPSADGSPAAIVAAVLRGGHDLVECPVKPPMFPEASLAVSRDHRIVLVAVAQQGLSDLSKIGRAYQWLIENRPLIAMAVPQMAIDAHQLPELHLLVDHADMSADVLQPILQSASVTVRAYRKLRWAGKTGLLLEAA